MVFKLEAAMEQNIFTNTSAWMVRHRHSAIETLRIFLGLMLFYKGLSFIQHSGEIEAVLAERIPLSPFIVAHYVVFAHIAGGAMLAVGLYTRFAALIQIPILAGAVLFIYDAGFMLIPEPEVEFPLLVLILLIVFLFYGAGKWSADHHLVRNEEEAI